MSKPTILTTSSILEALQWQPFDFQPQATNSPTAWIGSPLPPGAIFDTTTGRLSGPFTTPGVYVFWLTAINSDGASDPLEFNLGVEASSFSAPGATIDLSWDVSSGLVTNDAAGSGSASADGNLPNGKPPMIASILWTKQGDVRLFNVRPVKAGVTVDLNFTALALNLKQYESESRILTITSFARMAEGSDTFYQLAVTLTGDPLKTAVNNWDSGKTGTRMVAFAELTGTADNDFGPAEPPVGWPSTLILSSLDFGVGIERQLHA